MNRFLALGFATALLAGILPDSAQAQVNVRAPFVRVQVGGPGVYVRAPFVNLFIPSNNVYYPPPGVNLPPSPVFVPPPPQMVPADDLVPMKPANGKPAIGKPAVVDPKAPPSPKPEPEDDLAPPKPVQPNQVMTLQQFTQTFQPKAGSYEITLQNPITKAPTAVRFTLPDGQPRHVHLRSDEVEFDYGIRRFVRISFDRDGAIVTSR